MSGCSLLLGVASLALAGGNVARGLPGNYSPMRAAAGTENGSVGFLYFVSLNGTTNKNQLYCTDLNHWSTFPFGEPLDGKEAIGSAAAVDHDSGIYYQLLLNGIGGDPGSAYTSITAFSTASGKLTKEFKVDSLLSGSSALTMVSAFFIVPSSKGNMLVVAREIVNHKEGAQYVLDLDVGSGIATVRGSFNSSAGMWTWDASGETLWGVTYDENAKDPSGTMVAVSTKPGDVSVLGTFNTSNFFMLPEWNQKLKAIHGLELFKGPPGPAYDRRFATVDALSMNFTVQSEVSLSPFYVISEGPRAFDQDGQRAFYLMATSGPFGELDMATVDASTGKMIESPGVCGFIGDCPEAFAYSATGPSARQAWPRDD